MPISHKHKIIFVHIPKVAGSSIEKALEIYGINNSGSNQKSDNILFGLEGKNKYLQHLTISEIKERIDKKTFETYFKFSFVRNPYAKIVSDYKWLKNDKKKSFLRFILKVILLKNKRQHFRDQYKFLYIKNKLSVDFVGKLETIKPDIQKITNKIDVNLKMFHINTTKKENYRKYYNFLTRFLVFLIYRKDIKIFNYKF